MHSYCSRQDESICRNADDKQTEKCLQSIYIGRPTRHLYVGHEHKFTTTMQRQTK